jgi:hypothetical protein
LDCKRITRWNALPLAPPLLWRRRLNALEAAAPTPGIFYVNKSMEKLAFGDSMVLRTRRRSTFGLRERLAG